MSVLSTPRRPRTVALLIIGVFLLGIWNAGKAVAIAKESHLQLALAVTPDPRIRMVMAAIWGILFIILAGGLWWKRPFSRKATPIIIALYAFTELLQQHLFAQVDINLQLWWLTTLSYLLITFITYHILNRPPAQRYFDKQQG